MGYKEDVWNWLIKYGGAVEHEEKYGRVEVTDYYGGRLRNDRQLTIKVLEKIREHGINYEESTDPATHIGRGFNGTFASEELQFTYMMGGLVLGNGDKVYWGANAEEDMDFGGAVRLITQDIDLETALEHLEERLTDKESDWMFPYTCKLPRVKAVAWILEEQ